MIIHTIKSVQDVLRGLADINTAKKLARQMKVGRPFLAEVITGKYKPSPKILKYLGLRRVELYAPETGPSLYDGILIVLSNGKPARSRRRNRARKS